MAVSITFCSTILQTIFYTMNPTPSSSDSFSQGYSTIRRLGAGGFGTVYLVRRVLDGSLQAAKVFHDSKCSKKTYCGRRAAVVPDEILLTENLSHSNLIIPNRTYFEGGWWIIVMDYLPGYIDLFDHLSDSGALSVDNTRFIISQLVDVTCYLLSMGIDHRDIKDENILYNPSTRHIKLIDFGAAGRVPTPGVPYTSFCGTEVYMPPQYFLHGSYLPLPAITWTIGCLAYALLNGDGPFATPQEVASYRYLSFLNPHLDQGSKEFLRDLLERDEDDRMLPQQIRTHPWLL